MKFSENPFYNLKVTEQTQFQTENYKGAFHFQLKITKGHNSVKNVIQVMVLILYTSSDHPLYLYQVFKWTQKCTKENNSLIKGRVLVLFFLHILLQYFLFL